MKRKLLRLRSLVLLLVAFASLSWIKDMRGDQGFKTGNPFSDSFAFIEYYQIRSGRAIEGNAPPGRRIDGPTYSYNPEGEELISFISYDFNKDSLIAVIGRGIVLQGTHGGGVHSRLIPVATLPFTEERLTVQIIDNDSVYLVLNDEIITLGKGEKWEQVDLKIDTLFLPDSQVVIESTTTYSIKYHGLIRKEGLILR